MPRIKGKPFSSPAAPASSVPSGRPPAGGGGGQGRRRGQFLLGKLENLEPARQAYGDRLVIVRDDARQLGVMQAVIEEEQVEVVFNLALSKSTIPFLSSPTRVRGTT